MQLPKFLRDGLTSLFGDNSNKPAHDNSSKNLLFSDADPVTIKDIDILKEACLQMKEMAQVIWIAEEKFAKLQGISPELKENIVLANELTKNLMIDYVDWAQRCENIRKNAIIAGSIDQNAARLAIIEITSSFTKMLTVCAPTSLSICLMKALGPVDRGDEIETRLNTSIQKAYEMSEDLQSLIHKSHNFIKPGTPALSDSPALKTR